MDKSAFSKINNNPFVAKYIFKTETTSTNSDLKKLASSGAAQGTVIIADKQTAGKGRQDRSFFSEGGLYMSLLLRPKLDTLDLSFITPLVAIAVVKALDNQGIHGSIKWVNDIIVNEKKVCGILCETTFCEENTSVVVGIGVNTNAPKNGFPESLQDIAGVLPLPVDKETLANEIITNVFELYNKFDKKSLASAYKERCFVVGKVLTVSQGDISYEAKATGLTDDLRLIVQKASGELITLDFGDISTHI